MAVGEAAAEAVGEVAAVEGPAAVEATVQAATEVATLGTGAAGQSRLCPQRGSAGQRCARAAGRRLRRLMPAPKRAEIKG